MTPEIDFSAMFRSHILTQAQKEANKATLNTPHPTDKNAWKKLILEGKEIEACWTSKKRQEAWHNAGYVSVNHPDGQVKFRFKGDKELYNDY